MEAAVSIADPTVVLVPAGQHTPVGQTAGVHTSLVLLRADPMRQPHPHQAGLVDRRNNRGPELATHQLLELRRDVAICEGGGHAAPVARPRSAHGQADAACVSNSGAVSRAQMSSRSCR